MDIVISFDFYPRARRRERVARERRGAR